MHNDEPLLQVIRQEQIEEQYNRKHIDAKIKSFLESDPRMLQKINQGIELVQQYMDKTYYDAKNKRIEQLRPMDLRELVIDVYTCIGYMTKTELFTVISAILAGRLGFNDKREGLMTAGELLAVLCMTDVFDIQKTGKTSSLEIVPRVNLPESITNFIEGSLYLPPMVCSPLEVTHNFSSGYLTHNDSLILGTGTHHDGDICTDVLNTMNNVALTLDTQFLNTVEEEPTFELDDADKLLQWNNFKTQSYRFYKLMVDCGNRIYLTHKVDKRGRIYASGYHITTQGTAFKKAMLELANAELVTGVP